eukprot:13232707-Alexandrium_andersonii.AAC.1
MVRRGHLVPPLAQALALRGLRRARQVLSATRGEKLLHRLAPHLGAPVGSHDVRDNARLEDARRGGPGRSAQP